MAFGNYVALTLAKLTPGQFCRAKKLISDVLFDMKKDGMEQADSCPHSFPQHRTIGYVETMRDQPVQVLPVVIPQSTVTSKVSDMPPRVSPP